MEQQFWQSTGTRVVADPVSPSQIQRRDGMFSPAATAQQRAAVQARWLERRLEFERRRRERLRFALGFGVVAALAVVVVVVLAAMWVWTHIGVIVAVALAIVGVGAVLAAFTGWGGSGRTFSGTFQGKIH